jgi:hypothetical protein
LLAQFFLKWSLTSKAMQDYTTAIGDAGSRRNDYCSLKLSFEFGRQETGWMVVPLFGN